MVKKVNSIKTKEGKGANIKRLFPTENLEYHDPFVLLDEFFVVNGAGFPAHEHRGFEAITYMLEGSFRHKDNLGNDTEVFPGGCQRFTAGKGITHSEMPGTDKMNHGIQLWVNLPKKLKKIIPSYQQVDKLPKYKEDGIVKTVIVGEGSPIKLKTKVIYEDINLKKDKEFNVEMPKEYNGFIYVIEGELDSLKKGEALLISTKIKVLAKEDSRFVFIAGKPHKEQIILRGPFVE